jgi:hypothetical protein
VSLGKWLPRFRTNVSSSFSRVKGSDCVCQGDTSLGKRFNPEHNQLRHLSSAEKVDSRLLECHILCCKRVKIIPNILKIIFSVNTF